MRKLPKSGKNTLLSERETDQVENAPDEADYNSYIADMILELQQMAARAGQHALAERLLHAHRLAAGGQERNE